MSLTWRDNANNETGFVVERCSLVAPATTCTNFAQIALPGPRNNTGNVTYIDTTVTAGNSYLYRVAAFNAGGHVSLLRRSQPPWSVPAIPAAPTNFTVAVVKNPTGTNYTATLDVGGRHQPDQLHDPACHQPHVHDGPDDVYAWSGRQDAHADRESQHDLLLPDPGEQQHRRLVRLDERAAVPHSHAVTE